MPENDRGFDDWACFFHTQTQFEIVNPGQESKRMDDAGRPYLSIRIRKEALRLR